MTDRKSPGDHLLDLVVFGPAGLALTAAEEFPKLVDKGRHHLQGQVRTARFVGQVAVQMGRRQFDRTIRQLGSTTTTPARETPARATSARATSARATSTPSKVVAMPSPPSPAGPPAEADPAPVMNGTDPSRSLAIPGYDSLSASQVVQRLGGLSRTELLDVRVHEQSLRHRRTILNRVEQLLGEADAAKR